MLQPKACAEPVKPKASPKAAPSTPIRIRYDELLSPSTPTTPVLPGDRSHHRRQTSVAERQEKARVNVSFYEVVLLAGVESHCIRALFACLNGLFMTRSGTWLMRSRMMCAANCTWRSEEHTSELQSLMRTSYAV